MLLPFHIHVISNAPGPQFPLYFAGAKLVAAYPMGPIMEGAGMNVTVLSYEDNIDVGFLVDRELTPDVWDLAEAVEAAYDELLAAARQRTSAEPAAEKRAPAKKRSLKKGAAKKAPAKKGAAKKSPAKAPSAVSGSGGDDVQLTERGATVRTARKKPSTTR